jgi:alkylation response protein AidB-like acyl-CoA dehydrogenase
MIGCTDRQRELRELAEATGRQLGAEGAGNTERAGTDESGGFSWRLWKTIQDSGLLGLPFEARWGGLGADAPTALHALEAFGYTCPDAGLGFAVSTHIVSTGIPLHLYGSAALREQYLPRICDGTRIGAHAISEPEAGSDAAAMRTTAVAQGGSYVITGTKQYVSNGPVADLFTVYAQTSTPSGELGISAFLVPADTGGLAVVDRLETMGLRSCPLGTVRLEGCQVPAANLLGRPGAGFFILDQVMKWEVLCSFAITSGEMRRRLEDTVAFARSRRQFGRPIGDFQAVSHKIADMRITVATAHKWLFDTAERFAAGQDVTLDVAATKIVVSEGNLRTALDAVQIAGGSGYLTRNGLERGVRDAVAGPIYSGSSEIQRNRIAAMLGL